MSRKIRRTEITIKEGKVTVKESKVKVLDPAVDPEYCAMIDQGLADIKAGRTHTYTLEKMREIERSMISEDI